MQAKRLEQTDPVSFQLSLRIRHPSMDPAEISGALDIEPAHSFRAGAPRASARSGSAHTESYWLAVLPPIVAAALPFLKDERAEQARKQLAAASKSMSWALSLSAGRFCRAHGDFLRRIRAEGGDVTVLATIYSTESFTLAPETSQLLGELGIAIEFEIADE